MMRITDHNAVVVTATITTYTILHLGRLNDAAAPPALTPAVLLEFLQPPPAMLEYEPMSPDLPPLGPVALVVPIVKISSFDSPMPVPKLFPASDSI